MGYFGDYASMPIFDNGSEIYTVFGMQNVLLSESFCQLVKTIADKTMACTDNSLRGWAKENPCQTERAFRNTLSEAQIQGFKKPSDTIFISPNGDGLGDTLACFISVKRNGMFSGPYIYDENNELVYSETEENESDKIGVYDLMISDLADDEDFPEYFDCKVLPAFAQFWITGAESVGNELQKQFDFSDVIPAEPDAGGSFTVEYDFTDFSSYEIGAIDRAFNIADSDIMPDEVPVPGA